VVTNIDPEHLDHYGTFDAARKAFRDFVENVPFYGFAVICLDHPEVQALAATVENRRLITYGVNPQAEVRATKIAQGPDGARFDVQIAIRGEQPVVLEDMRLPMAGVHNVLNALAAIAVSHELGVSDEDLKTGLAKFGGVRRRFTTTGVSNGVRIIDDYGHHPVEIASVLKAARAVTEGKVIAVVQPHRFTRLRDLFADFCACFNDADEVIVADVYTAGEQPIPGIDRDALVEGLRRHGHRHALALPSVADLPGIIARDAQAGDVVVLLGAGDITSWSYALPGQLDALAKG
jgi:UDP-N-acetylmuramate--alanine ligase